MNITELKISKQILPYFKYYAGIYKPETGTRGEIIIIPMKDGSASLDRYFINPLLKNGYTWKESFLLSEIYLYKEF